MKILKMRGVLQCMALVGDAPLTAGYFTSAERNFEFERLHPEDEVVVLGGRRVSAVARMMPIERVLTEFPGLTVPIDPRAEPEPL